MEITLLPNLHKLLSHIIIYHAIWTTWNEHWTRSVNVAFNLIFSWTFMMFLVHLYAVGLLTNVINMRLSYFVAYSISGWNGIKSNSVDGRNTFYYKYLFFSYLTMTISRKILFILRFVDSFLLFQMIFFLSFTEYNTIYNFQGILLLIARHCYWNSVNIHCNYDSCWDLSHAIKKCKKRKKKTICPGKGVNLNEWSASGYFFHKRHVRCKSWRCAVLCTHKICITMITCWKYRSNRFTLTNPLFLHCYGWQKVNAIIITSAKAKVDSFFFSSFVI